MSDRPRILTEDDEVILCRYMALELEESGSQVLQDHSGNAALRIIEAERLELVLSDIRMPEGDGAFLLKEIKKRHPELPVMLFIKAFADISEEEAFHLDSEAIFKKPVNYVHL